MTNTQSEFGAQYAAQAAGAEQHGVVGNVGVLDLARQVLGGQVRIGRPLGIKGLPEAAKGPPFAGAVGLLIYPQVAHIEHFEPKSSGRYLATGTDGGYLSRVGRWLRESF